MENCRIFFFWFLVGFTSTVLIITSLMHLNTGQLIEKGNLQQKVGNYAQAEETWQQVLRKDSNNVVTLRNLGISLSEQNKVKQGAVEFDKVIELKPDSADASFSRGLKLYYQEKPKELDQASINFKETIKLDPNNAIVYHYLGNALSDQKKLDEAITQYNEAIKRDKNYARAYNNKGFALYNQEKWNEAIEQYDEAIKRDKNYARAYNNKGLALEKNGKLEEAIKEYKNSINSDPKYVFAQNNLEEAERKLALQKTPPTVAKSPSSNDKWSLLKRSVVLVLANIPPDGSNKGTGWVVRKSHNRTFIVTSGHVVASDEDRLLGRCSEEIEVEFFSENENCDNGLQERKRFTDCKVTPNKEDLDLALIEVADVPNDIESLPMSSINIDYNQKATNRKVTIIGHPSNACKWSNDEGEISNYDDKILQVSDVSVVPGYSGSPVLNNDDQVVGVVNSKPVQSNEKPDIIGFAFKIELVKKQLRDWKIVVN